MVIRSRWIASSAAAGANRGIKRHGAGEPHAAVQDAGQAEHVEQRQRRDVGQLQRDRTARPDPGRRQGNRQPVRGLVKLSVREPAAGEMAIA